MTPDQMKQIRLASKKTQSEWAKIFGVAGDRVVRRWEDGSRTPDGPTMRLYEVMQQQV